MRLFLVISHFVSFNHGVILLLGRCLLWLIVRQTGCIEFTPSLDARRTENATTLQVFPSRKGWVCQIAAVIRTILNGRSKLKGESINDQ